MTAVNVDELRVEQADWSRLSATAARHALDQLAAGYLTGARLSLESAVRWAGRAEDARDRADDLAVPIAVTS
jgi:hypothetical protein